MKNRAVSKHLERDVGRVRVAGVAASTAFAAFTAFATCGCGLFDGFGGADDRPPPPPAPDVTPVTPITPTPGDPATPPTGTNTGTGTSTGTNTNTGTGTNDIARNDPGRATEPCPDDPTSATPHFDAVVTWSNVRSTAGCFFFSGPQDLGRDDHLGGRARFEATTEGATLAFGAARFTGASAPEIHLSRTTTHDFGGAWRVTETLDGRWVTPAIQHHLDTPCTDAAPRTIEARYVYHEYEGQASTPGHCTITADVTIRAR